MNSNKVTERTFTNYRLRVSTRLCNSVFKNLSHAYTLYNIPQIHSHWHIAMQQLRIPKHVHTYSMMRVNQPSYIRTYWYSSLHKWF